MNPRERHQETAANLLHGILAKDKSYFYGRRKAGVTYATSFTFDDFALLF